MENTEPLDLVIVEVNNWTGNRRVLSSHGNKTDADAAAHTQALTTRWPSRYTIHIVHRADLPLLDAAIQRTRVRSTCNATECYQVNAANQ